MIVQFADKQINRSIIEASLRHDETIACDNATVIVDKNGNVTGWINNNAPLCVVVKENE